MPRSEPFDAPLLMPLALSLPLAQGLPSLQSCNGKLPSVLLESNHVQYGDC